MEPLAQNTTNQQNIFPYMYENTLVHLDIIFAIRKFEKHTFLQKTIPTDNEKNIGAISFMMVQPTESSPKY